MPRPTLPVKRVCYTDDITVWASEPKIPLLESMINSYLREVGIYLKENSLFIYAPKSTVTLFTPDTHQFQTHPDITLEDTQLPLERNPKILGVIMVSSLSFHKHCFKKTQTARNAALRTETGAHKMTSIDHLHQESLTLKVKDHSDMLSMQYLVNCLEEDHVCHVITTQEPGPRPMKETLHSRHHFNSARAGRKTSRICTQTL